jgi:hypothetical protein
VSLLFHLKILPVTSLPRDTWKYFGIFPSSSSQYLSPCGWQFSNMYDFVLLLTSTSFP